MVVVTHGHFGSPPHQIHIIISHFLSCPTTQKPNSPAPGVCMPSENGVQLPEADIGEMNFRETELTLRLPGESSRPAILTENNSAKMGAKRGLDLSLDCSSSNEHDDNRDLRGQENDASSMAMLPASKSQVVGWPPVRASRKQAVKSSKFIKVAVDGAPFLRKVDLEMYNSYQHLLSALEDMFSGLTIRNYMNEKNILDQGNAVEYVPTYEDKDGDWMMVGDVPWKMFVESCKRLRLMKSSESEAIELAPKTPSKCSSTC